MPEACTQQRLVRGDALTASKIAPWVEGHSARSSTVAAARLGCLNVGGGSSLVTTSARAGADAQRQQCGSGGSPLGADAKSSRLYLRAERSGEQVQQPFGSTGLAS